MLSSTESANLQMITDDKKISIEDIVIRRDRLKESLKPKRYEHSLGVAYTAASLAFIYNEDPLRAELAGILHDCAKNYSNETLISLCERDGIELSAEELASPQVIHARYGSLLAHEQYDISDDEILNAIRFHTTGRPHMTMLEKIIFVSDYIEPLRNEAPNLSELRKLAFRDIDECVYRILSQTVEYLSDMNALIVPDTLAAFEWYKNEREL